MGLSFGMITVVFMYVATVPFAEGLKCYECSYATETFGDTETVQEGHKDLYCKGPVPSGQDSIACPHFDEDKVPKCVSSFTVQNQTSSVHGHLVLVKSIARDCRGMDTKYDGCATVDFGAVLGGKISGNECYCSTDNCNGQTLEAARNTSPTDNAPFIIIVLCGVFKTLFTNF